MKLATKFAHLFFVFCILNVSSQNMSTETKTIAMANALEQEDLNKIKVLMEERKMIVDDIEFGSKEDFMPLVFAIGFNLDDVVSELLTRKTYLSLNNNEGNRALERACQIKNIELVKKLLKQKANANAYTDAGTPIYYQSLDSLSLLKVLVENGANLNLKSKVENPYLAGQSSVLDFAVMYSPLNALEYLIENEASVNTTNSIGWTPLHYAGYAGNFDAENLLIYKGANKSAKTTGEWKIMANETSYNYSLGLTAREIAMISNKAQISKTTKFERRFEAIYNF